MEIGDFLVRTTIWGALAGYALSVVWLLLRLPGGDRAARAWWTLGCGAYLVHVAAAFHFFYDWSHAAGLAETASQTEELAGVRSGSGLYLNYLFTGLWVADAVSWWLAGRDGKRERPVLLGGMLHAFFFFMVFNGTVVFGRGISRWIGVGITVLLAGALLRRYFLLRSGIPEKG